MGNEITMTGKLAMSKAGVTFQNSTTTKQQNLQTTLTGYGQDKLQNVGTGSSEPVDLGDIDVSKQHMIFLRNAGANFLTVYLRKDVTPTDTVAGILMPGESFGPIRAGAQTAGYPHYRVQGDTAIVPTEVVACEAGDPTL